MFDIQIKRLHEYKRQQMNALYVIYKYLEIKAGRQPQRPGHRSLRGQGRSGLCHCKGYHPPDPCACRRSSSNDPEVSPWLQVGHGGEL